MVYHGDRLFEVWLKDLNLKICLSEGPGDLYHIRSLMLAINFNLLELCEKEEIVPSFFM